MISSSLVNENYDMKQIILIFIFLLYAAFTFGQKMTVESFEPIPNDLIARTEPRTDLNDKLCAVIRVGIALQGVVFDGNTIGNPKYNTGEYLVYITNGSRQLTVRHDRFLPLTVTFSDYGIERIEAGNVYRLTILTGGGGSWGPVPLTHQQNNDQAIIVPEIEEFTVNGVTFRMIRVDGGSFTMGATKEQGTWSTDTDEYPTHKVKLGNFMIGETEVTQALWTAVMGSNPSHFHGANKPVEKVSWNDCQLFIEKLNKLTGKCFRLPTEAEWEYAARGGKHSCGFRYPGSNKPKDTCWYAGTNETKEVAKKCPNEIGIYDMGGNVWEWCNDWKGNYSSSDETNPTGPRTGVKKVLRGGSINSTKDLMRITHRSSNTPDYSKSYIGMRLAL